MISNEIGKRYWKLTVLEEVVSDVKGHRKYRCICDCGNSHICTRNNLLRGITSQCSVCSSLQRSKSQTTVNSKEHRKTYDSYRGLFSRCGKVENYLDVKVCARWSDPLNGYANFKQDMGFRPQGTTIDRIDYLGDYEPSNCRWAHPGIQNHNKSKRCDAKTSNYIGVSAAKDRWAAQLHLDGKHVVRESFATEEEAAIHYDNMSELYYGDRPNKTVPRIVTPSERRVGGVTYDKRYGSFRVRITNPEGKRVNVGNYKEELHAIFVLGNEITKYYY